MKKTLAAIWYMEEQNEPSLPFVLELEVAEDTYDSVAEALLQHAKETYENENVGEFEIVKDTAFFGTDAWQISCGDLHLFASGDICGRP